MFRFPSRALSALCALFKTQSIYRALSVFYNCLAESLGRSLGTCNADKSISECQIWRDTHLSHRNDNCSNHDRQRHPVVSHPAHSPDICSTALKITSPDRQSSPPSCHVISFMTAASCSSALPLPMAPADSETNC